MFESLVCHLENKSGSWINSTYGGGVRGLREMCMGQLTGKYSLEPVFRLRSQFDRLLAE